MRLTQSLSLFFLIGPILGCSSGLGDVGLAGSGTRVRVPAKNLGFGFDPGMKLTDAVNEIAIAGGLLPMPTGRDAEPVVFFAFSTGAAADDGDGMGMALAREAPADTNASSDIFIAAIVSSDIDTAAFTQGLASVFRHPRCTTCHSMNSPSSIAFASAPMHLGGSPPLGIFDSTSCVVCHTNVPDWRSPEADTDFRGKTVRELYDMALIPPMGMTPEEHFLMDPRVNWALENGLIPFGDNVADDDHDGIAEPEDVDGVARTVPGGRPAWVAKINAWADAGFPFSSADSAVNDIALVSRIRIGGMSQSGNGASRNPSIRYIPNPAFDPDLVNTGGTNVVGRLEIAFESDATDLVVSDTNGVTDIFRISVDVLANQDALGNPLAGAVNLDVLESSLVRVSLQGSTGVEADGASSNPVIAGSDGSIIAFESEAGNLLTAPAFQDNNLGAPDIFRHDLSSGATDLASFSVNGANDGGAGGGSRAPSVSRDGNVIAFESTATNLVGTDTNGVQDVFYSVFDSGTFALLERASVAGNMIEAAGGDSRNASVQANDALVDGVRIAFESEKTDLVPNLPPMATTNVYLFDSLAMTTTLLNQRIDSEGTVLGTARGGSAPADSRNPSISPDGGRVMFQTFADNLDRVRTVDENTAEDVMIADVSQLRSRGFVLPFRVSVTADGGTGNGNSIEPLLGDFETPSSEFAFGFSAYSSDASNLGNSDNGRHVITFLNESAGAVAAFDVDERQGAAPLTVNFTDQSSNAPSSWLWDFGDPSSLEENSSDLADPTHTYSNPGTYTVRLEIESTIGPATVERIDFIQVLGQVVPNFGASVSTGTVPFEVQFNDLSTEEPDAWAWDFGDGSTSTEQNPAHTYTVPGVYDVRLMATGPGGTDTVTKGGFITALAAVGAEFSGLPTTGSAPLDVDFTDLSSGNPDTWVWQFGDSGTSVLQNPTHTYVIGGAYNVTLTATGPGGTDVSTKAAYITVHDPVVAGFSTTSTRSGAAPLTIQFANETTGSADSWAWDFGDGSTSTNRDPSHVYASPGQFTVSLTSSGPGGSDTHTETNYVTVFDLVVAEFTGAPVTGNAQLSVSFTDMTSGNPNTWSWDFGDGATSTEQSPTHAYDAGMYTVALTATGPGGTDTETKVDYIDVDGPLVADFSLKPGSSRMGLPTLSVGFMDLSTGNPDTWMWDFGDGASSMLQNPDHDYVVSGVYDVSLTASKSGGVSDAETKTGWVTVFTPVQASFTSLPSSGEADLQVTFDNRTGGDAGTWLWDFGDPSSGASNNRSALESPSHTYQTAGTYVVKLTASGNGGMNSTTDSITVTPGAAFSASITQGFPGMQVAFTDLSTGAPSSWLWDFGDGSTSTLQDPSHRYVLAGTYDVSLTATGGGQSDTETKVGLIVAANASFTVSATKGYAGLTNFVFTDTSGVLNPATRTWAFGDGSPNQSGSTANQTYAAPSAPGNYSATLVLTDGTGGVSTTGQLIFVGDSFTTLYTEWMTNASCIVCHNDLGINNTGGPQGFLSFGPNNATWGTSSEVFTSLDKQSQSTNCSGMRVVEPGLPLSSTLFQSASNNACTSFIMPNANPALISSWITAGAENN